MPVVTIHFPAPGQSKMSSITTLEEATQAVWQAIETGNLSAVTAALAVWTGLKADAAAAAKAVVDREWAATGGCIVDPECSGCDCCWEIHDEVEDARLNAKEWSDAAELEAHISREGSGSDLDHCMRVWQKVSALAHKEMDEVWHYCFLFGAAPQLADRNLEAEREAKAARVDKEAKGWFKAYEAATAAALVAAREGLWPTAAY